MGQSTSHHPPPSSTSNNGVKAYNPNTADSPLKYQVDHPVSPDNNTMIDMSSCVPTAPTLSRANAQVYFHLSRTGHDVAPKAFPACVSTGKGVIVREGYLNGAWTCIRPFEVESEVHHCCCQCSCSCCCGRTNAKDPGQPRTVTFPADPTAEGSREHKIRIVGCREIEFSVLEDSTSTSAAELAPRFVKLKVKALVAAANEEFSPKGGTEGVPLWIGVDDSPDNIFRAVPGQCGKWEVRCDGGEVVRF